MQVLHLPAEARARLKERKKGIVYDEDALPREGDVFHPNDCFIWGGDLETGYKKSSRKEVEAERTKGDDSLGTFAPGDERVCVEYFRHEGVRRFLLKRGRRKAALYFEDLRKMFLPRWAISLPRNSVMLTAASYGYRWNPI